MIATQTQPNLTLYSWDVAEGMAVLRCRSEDGIGDVALGFTSLAELESFAAAAAQMAQDYRLSLSGEEPAPAMSEVDRLLVEAVVSSMPTHAADPGNAAASDAYLAQPPPPFKVGDTLHRRNIGTVGKCSEVRTTMGMFQFRIDDEPEFRTLCDPDAWRVVEPSPVDYAARNLAICNKARAGAGQPPLTQAEYDALPF